jgi:uncharacterized protein
MTSPLVIFHGGGCADGFCSGWLIWRYWDDNAEFHPANYEAPPPDVTDRDVLILDFSYRRPILEQMYAAARSLVVLDHHKTAQAELDGLDYCTFDMDRSGAHLTWDWLVEHHLDPLPSAPWVPPWIVSYVEDRDLWRWDLPDSRAINAAIRSYPQDFETWNALAVSSPSGLAVQGRTILRADQQAIETHCRRAREVDFDGHRVPIVNASVLRSEIGNALNPGRPFVVVWFERDGIRQYSLSSDVNGVDVSEIARAHGGGGHRHAAGFEERV